ncbi:hypothetical protein C5D04_03135 [Rathayibacter sp. AY1D2]|nr:hypothetical protein C5C69_14365 [Rathayibacter sp. AY1C7]PPI17986.1 hypothetical protein C5D04_03135 [Rathayibacter sp. AY1D2]
MLVEAPTVRVLDGPARVGTPRRKGRTTEELRRAFAAVLVLSLSVQRNAFAKSRLAGFSALLAIAGRMAAVRRQWLAESEIPFLGWVSRAALRPRCVRELLDQARDGEEIAEGRPPRRPLTAF